MQQPQMVAETAGGAVGKTAPAATVGPPAGADVFAEIFAKLVQNSPLQLEGGQTSQDIISELILSTQQLLGEGITLDPSAFDELGELVDPPKDFDLENLPVSIESFLLGLPAAPPAVPLPEVTRPVLEPGEVAMTGIQQQLPNVATPEPAVMPLVERRVASQPRETMEMPPLSMEPTNLKVLGRSTATGQELTNGETTVLRETKQPFGELGRSMDISGFARPAPSRPVIPASILPPETAVLQPVSAKPSDGAVGTIAATMPQGQPSNVQATTADRNAAALANVDRQEFVERMTEALKQAYQQSPKRLTIDLAPPELGKVRIQVVQVDGQLTAKIETGEQAARALLVERLPVLERQLAQCGIQLQRLDVQQAPEPTQASSGQQGNLQRGQGDQPNHQEQAPSQNQQQHNPHRPLFAAFPSDRGDEETLTMVDLLSLAPGMNRLI